MGPLRGRNSLVRRWISAKQLAEFLKFAVVSEYEIYKSTAAAASAQLQQI
jgi:uncharacterized protein YPO0396